MLSGPPGASRHRQSAQPIHSVVRQRGPPGGSVRGSVWTALARFREQQGLGSRQHRFRFNNELLSLDSTTISLCLTLFPWAQFRRSKGGVKAHVLLDHDDYLPAYVLLTEAKRSDVKLADSFTLNPGSIVTMDRGYTDYALFGRWRLAGVFFVTRMKDNAAFAVEANSRSRRSQHPRRPNHPTHWRPGQDRLPWPAAPYCGLGRGQRTRDRIAHQPADFGSTTVAAIYKERWKIELFFKALKQNLTVKSFVGTSENALRIQIWTALIALLLLKWLHHLSKANWSLSNLAYAAAEPVHLPRADQVASQSYGNAALTPRRPATCTGPP